MAQSRIDLIDTVAGEGTLAIEGRATPVKYVIRIHQETLDTSTGGIPGLMSASGQIFDLKVPDATEAIGRSVALLLEDGRRCDVTITAPNGTFLVNDVCDIERRDSCSQWRLA